MNNIITFENLDNSQIKTQWIGDRLAITWHKDQQLLATLAVSIEDARTLDAVIRIALEEITGIRVDTPPNNELGV